MTTPVPPDFPLALRLQNFSRRYGVVLRFLQGGKETKVHYEADFFSPFAASDGTFQLSLQKHQVFVNDRAPDSIMDILADACGKVLYPILFKGGPGAALRGILNGDTIRARWADAALALYEYYTGDVATNILSAMERAVASDARIFDALREDWLLALLFAPIFQHYTSHEATADFLLPLIPYRPPVRFTATLTIEPSYTKSGLLAIACRGTCTDRRPPADILKGHAVPVSGGGNSARGEIALHYKVYPTNGTIFSVTGRCSFILPDGSEKGVEVELYQLDKPASAPAPRSSGSLIVDAAVPAEKKSGWRTLFG